MKLKNANENEQLCHPELDSGSLKETEILNINKSCKTEQSTFQNDSVGNVIAGLTHNRVPERERAERISVRMERQRIRIAEQRGLLSPKGQLSESVEQEANSRQAEGLIRRREGGGVGKPKCRYMRVSKTAHHPDTKMQGGTSNGRGKRKIAARIIGARPADGGNGTGVTSGSTRRAGFACAHTAQPLTNDTQSFVRQSPKFGFTLAEVLITLGIIGIVAAMTMPALVQKYKEKQRVSQLKKAYSVLNQAFTMAVNDYGTPDNWGLVITNTGEKDNEGNDILDYTGSINAVNILKKYVKQKTIAENEIIGYVKSLDGRQAYWPWKTTPERYFYLADGTLAAIGWINDVNCTDNCSDFWVVFPGKNMTLGVDVFNFILTKKGFVPSGIKEIDFKTRCNIKGISVDAVQQGRGCTAWVLLNGNMDYLHCDDLSLNGKTKCK